MLLIHPISLVLPKETGWSPKEKRLGWWRPREVSGPARLSHSRGRCHSAAEVSAPRTIAIWALRAAGMVKTPRRGVFLFQYGVRGKPTFGRGWDPAPLRCRKQVPCKTYPPRRGRRPRRPAATVTAGPTAFRRPPPGAGLSPTPRRRTSPVGDGVLDVPPPRSPPALPRSSNPL